MRRVRSFATSDATSAQPPTRKPGESGFLVIAYGNELRGDDGAGPEVARLLASPPPADCEVIAVHQLTPDLAEPVSRACRLCFVDAREPDGGSDVRVEPLQPSVPSMDLGHHTSPGAVLAIADALYGHAPQAWLVSVPSVSFELGLGLSATAARGAQDAAERIRCMARHRGTAPHA